VAVEKDDNTKNLLSTEEALAQGGRGNLSHASEAGME
jgi:hypothetical protein